MSKVYQMVQEKIVQKIEKAIEEGGTVPWRKPWKGGIPRNFISKKEYRGINLLLLNGGSYLTFKQIQDLAKKNPEIKLRKGSKSEIIVFWNFIEKTSADSEDEDKYPLLKYYRVFSVSDVDGIEEEEFSFENDPIEQAEEVIQMFSKEVMIYNLEGSRRAFYSPISDHVVLPTRTQFEEVEEYYAVAFHEMVHSTGHISRLKRFSAIEDSIFGSTSYSKEELVAEIGSNQILAMLGIENEKQQENTIAYLYGWLKAIKKDPKLIVHAAQQSQKAADYILNYGKEDETELLKEVMETGSSEAI